MINLSLILKEIIYMIYFIVLLVLVIQFFLFLAVLDLLSFYKIEYKLINLKLYQD